MDCNPFTFLLIVIHNPYLCIESFLKKPDEKTNRPVSKICCNVKCNRLILLRNRSVWINKTRNTFCSNYYLKPSNFYCQLRGEKVRIGRDLAIYIFPYQMTTRSKLVAGSCWWCEAEITCKRRLHGKMDSCGVSLVQVVI